ncbi:MAG: hypothetical protein U0172_13900 [Nitrospiraceae bacterium]
MKRVPIEDAQPEMVLAKPVTNPSGLPIMPAGAVLDTPTIERLSRMGVAALYVVSDGSGPGEKSLAELEADLAKRFRRVINDATQQRIHKVCLAHIRHTYSAAPPAGGAGK